MGWKKCSLEDVENDYVYRGASGEEAKEVIKKGHAVPQHPLSLIGNDWEVLEYSFEELRSMSPEEAEEFLRKVVPEWATKQGVNLTTDLSNALGYAESRPNGKLLVFDISELEPDEIFQPSDVHIQAKTPEKVKLVAVCDVEREECLCKVDIDL